MHPDSMHQNNYRGNLAMKVTNTLNALSCQSIFTCQLQLKMTVGCWQNVFYICFYIIICTVNKYSFIELKIS